jgi:hypothetical protein
MSYLLSSGCSHSIGWEIEEEIGLDLYKDGHNPKVEKSIYEYRYDKTFPYLISKHLNLDYVNIGCEGNSNEKIIYDIIDYIKNTDNYPKFVLINLSGESRKLHSFKDNLININYTKYDAHGDYFFTKNFKSTSIEKFKEWHSICRDFFLNDYELVYKNERLIEYIVLLLENLNISYFISDTFNNSYSIKKYTNNCIDENMVNYLDKNNVSQSKGNHWLSDGHKLWSELLIKNIKNE